MANKLLETETEEEDRVTIMSFDEAQILWQEIDNYKYGYISGNLLQRWLEESAGFKLPISDVHYLYDVF